MKSEEMARAYAVAVIVILAATTVVVSSAGMYITCEGDHECGRDKYCYTLSGYCVPCTDCSMYKRENRTLYPYCARSAVECGKCLPGFEEEIFTTGEVRFSCIPVLSQSQDSSATWYIILGVFMTICLLLASVYFAYKSYRKKERGRSVQEECAVENQSLSANISPLLITSSTAVKPGVSDIRETSFTVCGGKERYPLQQARPFQDPDAPYHSGEEQDEPPNTPPYLYDDETMETTWTPPPGYGEAVPASSTNESNNQGDDNELPTSSQSANTASTSVDSGLSNSPATSSVSLLHRPFQGLGSSSNAVASVEQPLTALTRSHSDDDVSTSAHLPKRARRDSGAQSLDEDKVSVSGV